MFHKGFGLADVFPQAKVNHHCACLNRYRPRGNSQISVCKGFERMKNQSLREDLTSSNHVDRCHIITISSIKILIKETTPLENFN